MHYREHDVPSALSPVVDGIWTLEGGRDETGDGGQPVVPDGRSEIILHFGDAFERIDDGVATRQPQILFAGQLERPLILRPTGATSVLGIRLRSSGAPALMRVPQHELVGRTDEVRAISRPLADWLGTVRDSATSLDDAVGQIHDSLGQFAAVDRIDPRVAHAVSLIDAHQGLTVSDVATRSCMTPRQLERLFRDAVGLSPKMLMRIRRLQRALSLVTHADTDEPRPGTIAAIDGGYADHAHFIRDCRALAGFTPGDHLLRRAELTGVFLQSTT